jgi:hypothetical protein
MDISPARNVKQHHEALAAGRFGETCANSRKHGGVPDPNAFARRFVENQRCQCSAPHEGHVHDFGEGADTLSRVA